MTSRFATLGAALALLASLSAPAVALDAGPTVDHAWARATASAASAGAAYFTVSSPTPDKLVAVASPVAGKAEIHTHIDDNGVMRMRPVAGGIALPAGESVELKPSGLHVMLMGLKQPLKEGETFPMTLTFEKAGPRVVTVEVTKIGAMGPAQHAQMEGGAMSHDHMDHGAMGHGAMGAGK
jgi:copper(I)-binding protein